MIDDTTKREAEAELLPCPCCKGDPQFMSHDDMAVILCRQCSLRLTRCHENGGMTKGDAKVVAAWNQRASLATPSVPDIDLDQLLYRCDKLGEWMSAALDDPKVCKEMKADLMSWFDALSAYKPAVPDAVTADLHIISEYMLNCNLPAKDDPDGWDRRNNACDAMIRRLSAAPKQDESEYSKAYKEGRLKMRNDLTGEMQIIKPDESV